jgi:hypothetical protein
MSNIRRLALASVLSVAGSATSLFAAEPAAQILHHESISMSTRKSGSVERMSFDAFGKRFELVLQPNERIPASAGAEPFRGEIEGLPGSWARLTRGANGRWQGMVSDGQEIYAIEPASDVKTLAVQPLEKSGSEPVMYRLADLLLEAGTAFCEVVAVDEQQKTTALEVYKSLSTEMHAQAAGASRQLSVGIVADNEFASFFHMMTETPQEAVIARMNVVDGIYSSQVGVAVEVPTITIQENVDDGFTKTEGKELLDEVRRFRRASSEHMALGLTHLMTGRDLNGDTVGIAYLGTVCGGEYAVSLSESARGVTMASLIAAHEIGHNFNAPHDGDGACATEAQTFLMAPRINFNDRFSSCSLGQIQTTIASARCLTPISPANEVVIDAPTETNPGNTGGGDSGGGGGALSLGMLGALGAIGALRLRKSSVDRLRR